MDTIKQIHKIKTQLTEQQIIFCYAGYITEDVLVSVGNTIKQKLELVKADRSAARAVFAIFVEEAQNIIRYSKAFIQDETGEFQNPLRFGFVAVGKSTDRYYVCCGNRIQAQDVARLDGHLQHLQGLDADGLKTLFKETLRDDPPEGSKGAGVGFIDIARRAKGGFEFSFEDITAEYADFYIKAYV